MSPEESIENIESGITTKMRLLLPALDLLIDRLYKKGIELCTGLAGAGSALRVPAVQYEYSIVHKSRALFKRRAPRRVQRGGEEV